MDPLSITTSVLALATAAHQIGTAISRLRRIGELPSRIYALKNDVSELEVVLQEVARALEHNCLSPENTQESLDQVLVRTKDHLTSLTQALEQLSKVCKGPRAKSIIKTALWAKEKETFQKFRDDIASVKATLNLMLGAVGSQHLQRVDLELQKITILTAKSAETNVNLQQGMTEYQKALSTRMDEQHQNLSDRISALTDVLLPQPYQRPSASSQEQPGPSPDAEPNNESIRVVATYRRPCRHWCPCKCHAKQKLSLKTPGMVEAMVGRIFIGYSGLPLMKKPCDFRGCEDRRRATATVEYWFPSWFVSMNAKLHLTYLPRVGPEYQLSTIRRVADDSPSITFAMQGNIEGLKHLFAQGLAGPRDVSDSRGYTLMRWALYGGMHNHETVQFLINEGANVDEESYDNVWDFIFRGKCSESQQSALRCITEGGEGDWKEEQNFPLIHRIVFGMSEKPLATEISEQPHAVHLTDAQNRTALHWATARSQLADMVLLLRHGASPNNMDVTGRTAVLHAVDSHNPESLQLILEAGGYPNPEYPKGTFRSSPLTAAGFAGMPELLAILLKAEANVKDCNPEGLTALHSVAQTQNTECAALLLDRGADLNAVSNNGQTPMTIAIMRNNHQMLQLFMDKYYDHVITTPINGKF